MAEVVVTEGKEAAGGQALPHALVRRALKSKEEFETLVQRVKKY